MLGYFINFIALFIKDYLVVQVRNFIKLRIYSFLIILITFYILVIPLKLWHTLLISIFYYYSFYQMAMSNHTQTSWHTTNSEFFLIIFMNLNLVNVNNPAKFISFNHYHLIPYYSIKITLHLQLNFNPSCYFSIVFTHPLQIQNLNWYFDEMITRLFTFFIKFIVVMLLHNLTKFIFFNCFCFLFLNRLLFLIIVVCYGSFSQSCVI